jgi:hypothetical protein
MTSAAVGAFAGVIVGFLLGFFVRRRPGRPDGSPLRVYVRIDWMIRQIRSGVAGIGTSVTR